MASLTHRSSKTRFPSGRGRNSKGYKQSNYRRNHNHISIPYENRKHRTSFDTELMCPHILQGKGCPDKEKCKFGHTPEECVKLKWTKEQTKLKSELQKLNKIKDPKPSIIGKIAEINAKIEELKVKIEKGIQSREEWKKKQELRIKEANEKAKTFRKGLKRISVPTYYRVTSSKTDKKFGEKFYKQAIEGSVVEVPLTSKMDENNLLIWLKENTEERQILIKQILSQKLFFTWPEDKPVEHKPCRCPYGDKCPWNAIKISNFKLKNKTNLTLYKKLDPEVAKNLTFCANTHEHEDSKMPAEDDIEDKN
jgi:hypothetical protein